MMKFTAKKAALMAVLFLPLTTNTLLADEDALAQRIDRVERIIQGQGLTSLLGRVDQLQNEVKRLTGENESLRHELETMQKRQREMYLDLDQRIQNQTVVEPTPAISPSVVPVQQVQEPAVPSIQQVESAETAIQQAAVESPSDVEASPVAVENGEAAYQAALQTLRSGQYEQAASALAVFPEQYPQSSYLPNAYYWQGEANYVLRNFDAAITAFQTVIDQFPASSKVADATLKQGFSQYELGKVELATTTLARVIEQYPNTSAARLAKVRLDRIKQETR